MSYRAVSDRVVLIPEKLDGKIDGILIPDSSKDRPKSGVVESVGLLCKETKPGYKILFLEGHGASFCEDGVDKLVLREADILCDDQGQGAPSVYDLLAQKLELSPIFPDSHYEDKEGHKFILTKYGFKPL